MQIIRNASSVGKNMRIRMNAHSKSRDKLPPIDKDPSQMNQNQHISLNQKEKGVPKRFSLSITNKAKQSKQRSPLKLTPPTKNKLNLNLNRKNEVSYMNKPKKMTVIQLLINTKLQQEQMALQSRISSRVKQQNLLQWKNQSQQKSLFQKNSYFEFSHQNLSKLRGILFQISSTVSIHIGSFNGEGKVSFGTQTHETNLDDKFYLAYKQHRILKEKNYQQMIAKQAKIQSTIKQTQDFDRNNEQLLKYIKSGPTNGREQRVFGLSVDLEKQEYKIKEIFEKMNIDVETEDKKKIKKAKLSSRKAQILIESIEHLIKACRTELKQQTHQVSENFNKQSHDKSQRTSRILKRVLVQFHHLVQFYNYKKDLWASMMQNSYKEKENFITEYDNLRNLQYENKVLIYNFIQQISKIPILTNSLFGSAKQPEEIGFFDDNKQNKDKQEKWLNDFMLVKCERCYEMNRKIEMLKISNSRIWPCFKVAEWLVRDVSKPKHLLELI